jgi:flavin-dependent dehydrogenase
MTLDPAFQRCEVLIVGGGPGGSACAWHLVRAGVDVVVFDRATFPRDKVCAGWITPQIVASLDFDLDDYRRRHLLQPIRGFRTGVIGNAPRETHFGKIVSYAIRRCEFDTYLLRRSGARLELGQPLQSLERTTDGWCANGRILARMLIGAGGHFCPVARRLNDALPDEATYIIAQEAEFEMTESQRRGCQVEPEIPEVYFCRDLQGYGWCVRKGNYLNVGLGHETETRLAVHMEPFLKFLKESGRINFDLPARLRGHAYRLQSGPRPRLVDEAVLLIGDAAGLAAPRSGEGIRPAIESGLLAAETILAVSPIFSRRNLMSYVERLQERFHLATEPQDKPGRFYRWVGRQLLSNSWFTRDVVLRRWFLNAAHPPLRCEPPTTQIYTEQHA